jgi:hypothetical protein
MLQGQAVVGTLSGKVTAADGTGVPNAAVNITNQQTNVSQRVLTGPDGNFSIAGLAPGTYRVEVESAGFKRTAVSAIELTAGAPQTLTITLEAGPATETVELTARSAMVQTENATPSLSLTTRATRSYPILDRNWMELNGLMTGVTPPFPAFPAAVDPAQQRFYSVTGQNPFLSRHYQDGMINHEPFRGMAIRVAPVETIREMSIRTASLPAERGFTAAGWSNLQSQSGTNDWHGSAFWFNSLDEYNTRPWFSPFGGDNGNGDDDPRNLVYNQFGGTVGGPVRTDSTFFFGSYEGTYNRDHRAAFATVPTLEMRQGNFSGLPGVTLFNPATGTANGTGRSQFTNNVIPAGQINPFSSSIANALPAPNLPGTFQNFSTTDYLRRDGNKFDGRLDQRFGDNTNFFLRYGYSNWGVVEESPLGETFGGGFTTRLVAQNAIASITHNFSPTLLAELRLGYNRYRENISPRSFGASSILGVPSNQLPAIQFAGGTTLSPYPEIGTDQATDNTYNLITDWMATRSRHQFRWGFDVRNLRSTGFNTVNFGPRGTAVFGPGPTSLAGADPTTTDIYANSFASFLIGAPSSIGATAFQVTPGVEQWKFAGYVADRLNLTIGGLRGVTLDLGVRYDVFSPLKARTDGSLAFYNPTTNTFDFAGVGDIDRSFQDYDLNNVSPRVGIAISPGDRTVIRAGYSLNYFQVPYRFSGIQPAVAGSVQGSVGTFTPVPVAFGPNTFQPVPTQELQNGVSAGNIPATFFGEEKAITPYVHTYNFQIQQELPASMLFQVGYVGSLGRQLPFLNNLNVAAPGTGVAGLPFINAFGRTAGLAPLAGVGLPGAGIVEPTGRTAPTLRYDYGLTNNYNSLQTSLSKRLSHGVNFQVAYTYAKALDYTSDFGLLLNPFDRQSNYGNADYDRQHVLSIAHLFEVPLGAGTDRLNSGVIGQILGGWQINGVFRWATGAPFTVLADPLGCNCPGVPVVTANVIGDPDIADDPGPNRQLFNPVFFSQPAGGFGNLGRNVLRNPSFTNYDLSVFKMFGIRDKYRVEFRGAAYNLTNTPRFDTPVNLVNSPALGEVFQPLPGVDGLNNTSARVITLGARFIF